MITKPKFIQVGEAVYTVVKWVDAYFYPKRHKMGFHKAAHIVIKERQLRYNKRKERWEEPVVLIGNKECLFTDRFQK